MCDENDDNTTRVMFGDPFGNRGDYSKGIFYGGRRRYLHSKPISTEVSPPGAPPIRVNIMEPPKDFMTLKQKRNNVKLRKEGITLMQRLEFKKSAEVDDGTKAVNMKKAEAVKSRVVITSAVSSKSDWDKLFQAGVTFWVHKDTGITSMVCPYEEEGENLDGEETKWNDVGPRPATGSLVYDGSEFERLMYELDHMEESVVK